jgi:hypothetical protein
LDEVIWSDHRKAIQQRLARGTNRPPEAARLQVTMEVFRRLA